MSKRNNKPPKVTHSHISIQVDKNTLQAFIRVAQSGLKQEFEDTLFHSLYLNSLRSLIVKLAAASMRIRKYTTVRFTLAEAFCYRLTVEFWNEHNPAALECIVSKQYFPLNQNLKP